MQETIERIGNQGSRILWDEILVGNPVSHQVVQVTNWTVRQSGVADYAYAAGVINPPAFNNERLDLRRISEASPIVVNNELLYRYQWSYTFVNPTTGPGLPPP